ncbi:MAG: MarR family transcriptional regulator [Aliarcobacter sp.]|jgi:DNA-binding MarR family transcriptional regulator|nr:MarR family transcriptional regulator [Aliarcobacter sp.]MDX9901484.1 MarR family transcriptional regulator [Aliarcobacter sp.]
MNYLIEKYIGIKVAKVRNSIKNEMEIALMPYNITTTQFVVLVKLCEKDRMTQKDLANETNYKQSALTLILDKLESKELIIREAKENDRRAYLIAITNEGRELERKLIVVAKELEKRILDGISDEQKKEFLNTLDKIFYNLNKDK